MMKAKMRMIISVGKIMAVCLLFLVSCSSQKETSAVITAVTTEDGERTDTEDGIETGTMQENQEEGKEYQAILHVDDEIYYEITLKKGRTIPTLNREGYQFEGYYTDTDVNYVEADGTVTRTYHGAERLDLYPRFLPLNYTITFFQNGRETGISKLTCGYDKNLMEVLPFGELLGEECVIGFQDESGTMRIDVSRETFYLKDIKHLLDTEKQEVRLEIRKTFTSFQDSRLDTYEVSDSGFFRQKLHAKGTAYDRFFLEEVEIKALESLGYQNAEIELSCLIQEVDTGDQYIRVYSQKTSDKKAEFIMESGKIEDMEQEEEKLYTMKATVPIEKLESRELYVYYNAGGFGKDDWVSRGMTISVVFTK